MKSLNFILAALIAILSVSCASRQKETDNSATEKVSYRKILTSGKYSFDVASYGEGSIRKLVVQPKGFSIVNTGEEWDIDGEIVDAETADLNQDGFPELLILIRSAGSGSYGDVIAYSSNNGRSMSRASFPNTAEESQIREGYMGHDEFSVENNRLIQKFPVYKPNDINSKPTGGMRRVEYKLINGEASRIFVIEDVKNTP